MVIAQAATPQLLVAAASRLLLECGLRVPNATGRFHIGRRHTAGLLAPAYTPLIWLAGIALVGASSPYVLLSLLSVGVHVYHNILAHGLP
jgi:hypothetical protein